MVANDLFARYGRSNESVADYAWTSLQNEMSQYLDEVHGQSPGYLGLLTDGLPVVSRIRAALAEGRQSGQAGSVAILGAPGSGKTEQLLAALKKDVPVFDLRNLFLEGRDESDYDRYKTDMELKREETEWLKDQVARWKAGQENKLSAVLDTDTDTLIFDEFDLAVGEMMQGPEVETAHVLADLVRFMKEERGKNVVIILHSKGVRTPGYIEALASANFLRSNQQDIPTP